MTDPFSAANTVRPGSLVLVTEYMSSVAGLAATMSGQIVGADSSELKESPSAAAYSTFLSSQSYDASAVVTAGADS